jgi:uncharacterized protein
MRTHNRQTYGDGRGLVDTVRSGNLDEIKRLLGDGTSEQFMDETHKMALTVACEEGLTEVVEVLIDRRLGLNGGDEYGSMALIKASLWGQARVVRLLLERGAKVNAKEPLLRATALMFASLAGLVLRSLSKSYYATSTFPVYGQVKGWALSWL